MVLLGFVRPNSPQRRGVAEGSHLLAETLEALAAPAWPALRIRVYPCPSVAKSLVFFGVRSAFEVWFWATDGHGYTRMRSAGFLALDREKIGTKLYGYVLAKRYTTVVPRFSKFPTAVWGLAAFCLARSRRDGRGIRLNGCLTASMPQGPRLFFRTRTRH